MDGLIPSLWEGVAAVLGLAYLVLASRASIWCWPCALVSTAIYTWLFWEVALPFQSVLNGYYLLMAVYGWLHWQRETQQVEGSIQQWTVKSHTAIISILLVISLVVANLASHWFDSAYLYLDVLITVFSLFVTYMVVHKVLENWLYWMAINSAAIYLYWQKDMYMTTILFSTYLVFSVYGYLSWKKMGQQQLVEA